MHDTAYMRSILAALSDEELVARIATDKLAERDSWDDTLISDWVNQEWYETARRGKPEIFQAGLDRANEQVRRDKVINGIPSRIANQP
jgi:hypothetical protein